MSIKIKRIADALTEKDTLQWIPTKPDKNGDRACVIACDKGHFIRIGGDNSVTKKGKVKPTVECPYCDWEGDIILEDWDV